MIGWIVSVSILIILITAVRFLRRDRPAPGGRYAFWLSAALCLLILFFFLRGSIGKLNLPADGEAGIVGDWGLLTVGKGADGKVNGTVRPKSYVKELPINPGDGGRYVLQISGRTVPGTGEYHTRQIVFFLDEGGDRMIRQTIAEGDVKVLYTRPAGDVRPFQDSRGANPWIFSSGQDALFAKPLCTRQELPDGAGQAFGEGSGGEMWSYAPDGGIIVADLNFDGYNDFCVQGGVGSVNVPYYCFLWNEGRFEPGYMIPNVRVNQKTGLIESLTKDGEGVYSIKYYRFDEENTLHLVRYVEENKSPDAVFPVLDLTYSEEGYYTLPAVDEWDYLTEYGGALAERLVYWAKQALTELYAWSGTKIDKACFSATAFGSFYFADTREELAAGREYYSRTYGDGAGFEDCIESMWVYTDSMVWYSDVKQWNVPDDLRNMTDIQLVEWYFGFSALTQGEQVAEIEESYEDNYVVRTESGHYYELTLDPASREVSSVYGPYDSYPLH